MSRLDELIAELCPHGVEYKSLGEIATISRGGNFQKKDFCDKGIPCIHYGQIYTKYGLFADKTITFITEERAKKQKFAKTNDIVMAVTSENIEDVCKCLAWLGNEDVAVSGHSAIISHNQNPKYLVHYFHSKMFFAQKRKLAHGTKVIEVTPDTLKSIRIPVPPLEVQREIVHILDSFTLLTAELTAELTARKKQYEFYRDKLLFVRKDIPMKKIGDLCIVNQGLQIPISERFTSPGKKRHFYITVQFLKNLNSSEKYYIENPPESSLCNENDILVTRTGSTGKIITGVKGCFHNNFFKINILDESKLDRRYFYHVLSSTRMHNIMLTVASGGTVPDLPHKKFYNLTIPVPSIDVQQRLVKVLDNFESICTDLNIGLPAEIEARKKQYEYYRDKLLSFKELPK